MDDGPGLQPAWSDVGCCRSDQVQVQGGVSGPGEDTRSSGVKRDAPVQHRHAPVSEEGGEPLVRIAFDVGDARMTGAKEPPGEVVSVLSHAPVEEEEGGSTDAIASPESGLIVVGNDQWVPRGGGQVRANPVHDVGRAGFCEVG